MLKKRKEKEEGHEELTDLKYKVVGHGHIEVAEWLQLNGT